MDSLKVERVGGFAGFGGPGSRLHSRGTVALSALPAADRAAVDQLFGGGSSADAAPVADGFRYRITRETAAGPKTIEAPEAAVPAALRDCVRDELD